MNALQHLIAPLAPMATGALISALWQGAVLTALVAFALRLMPRISAAARSFIWLNVFLLLLLLHLLPLVAERAPMPIHPVLQLSWRWSLAVAAVWLTVSAFRAVQLLWGAVHLARLAGRSAAIPVDAELRAILHDAPLGRSAELCTSSEVSRPSFLGFIRPRILVPPALVDTLTPQELRQVVLHEMEHLRRLDDWTNLLQKLALVLFPLNPVLIWVERRLCAERELACDDRVVSCGGPRKAYALCLTRLAEFSILHRGYSLILGAWERRPELVHRVERILSQPVRTMGRGAALAASACLVTGTIACTLLLAHSPQLVSFAPAYPTFVAGTDVSSPSSDIRTLSQALGGKPEFVKAIMPTRPASALSKERTGNQKSLRAQAIQVVARRSHRRTGPADRMANLNPQPATPALFVLTEWTGDESGSRLIVFSQSQKQPRHLSTLVPVSYAAVPTPMGWLILQI